MSFQYGIEGLNTRVIKHPWVSRALHQGYGNRAETGGIVVDATIRGVHTDMSLRATSSASKTSSWF